MDDLKFKLSKKKKKKEKKLTGKIGISQTNFMNIVFFCNSQL